MGSVRRGGVLVWRPALSYFRPPPHYAPTLSPPKSGTLAGVEAAHRIFRARALFEGDGQSNQTYQQRLNLARWIAFSATFIGTTSLTPARLLCQAAATLTHSGWCCLRDRQDHGIDATVRCRAILPISSSDSRTQFHRAWWGNGTSTSVWSSDLLSVGLRNLGSSSGT